MKPRLGLRVEGGHLVDEGGAIHAHFLSQSAELAVGYALEAFHQKAEPLGDDPLSVVNYRLSCEVDRLRSDLHVARVENTALHLQFRRGLRGALVDALRAALDALAPSVDPRGFQCSGADLEA